MDYKLTAACEEAYLRLENATSEVMLLGTVAAARAANDVTSQAVAMVNLIDNKRITEKTWREAREKLGVLRNGVLLPRDAISALTPGSTVVQKIVVNCPRRSLRWADAAG